jgi:hypothetical protein
VTPGYDVGGAGVQVAGPDSRVPPLPPGGGGAGEGLARGPRQVVRNQCVSTTLGYSVRKYEVHTTEYIGIGIKRGKCICPLSWIVHCTLVRDGKYSERVWTCTPHPHQPGLIFSSFWNVRQKVAVATLCVLCVPCYFV